MTTEGRNLFRINSFLFGSLGGFYGLNDFTSFCDNLMDYKENSKNYLRLDKLLVGSQSVEFRS
jgi:hypothetical protein